MALPQQKGGGQLLQGLRMSHPATQRCQPDGQGPVLMVLSAMTMTGRDDDEREEDEQESDSC